MIVFKLIRVFFGAKYTIGHLYYSIDNEEYKYLCDTIEDTRRPNGVKIYGQTCIEDGDYEFIMYYSPHFKRILPVLLNVPMFQGVMIHNGTDQDSTEGCIVVGENRVKGKVINSKINLDKLLKLLDDNKQDRYQLEIIDKK